MQNSATKTVDTGLKYLINEAPLKMRITGTCMMPLIEDGATIQVSRQRIYLPGDILIKRAHNNRLIAHRLIGCYPRKGGLHYVTQADNAVNADLAVSASQVVGKLSGGDCEATAINIPVKSRIKALGQFFLLVIQRIRRKVIQRAPTGESQVSHKI